MLDRDFAAWIVLKRGLAQVGQDMPELKPVETGPLPIPQRDAQARSVKRELYAMKQGLEAHDFSRGRMSIKQIPAGKPEIRMTEQRRHGK